MLLIKRCRTKPGLNLSLSFDGIIISEFHFITFTKSNKYSLNFFFPDFSKRLMLILQTEHNQENFLNKMIYVNMRLHHLRTGKKHREEKNY